MAKLIGHITVTRTVVTVVPVLDTDWTDFDWREDEPNEDDMTRVCAYRSGTDTEDIDYDFVRHGDDPYPQTSTADD